MFKSKIEKYFFTFFLIVVIALFINKFYVENNLERDGIFIIGSFKDKTFGSESGWVYSYTYVYKNKLYTRNFSCTASEQMKNDTLLFFHILPKNPKICRQFEEAQVPKCIRLKDVPENGWKELPKDTCR